VWKRYSKFSRRQKSGQAFPELFDLGFLKDDVFAGHGIKFLQLKFVCFRPGVLLRHIKEPGIGTADEFDQHGVGFRHFAASRGLNFNRKPT
jgi:hypothetical protein